MRGPKPTPRNLRIVKGSDRPSRMNDDEPIVKISIPEPPPHLSDTESDKFREMAAKLARMKVMSDVDVDALAIYAVNWVRLLDANDKIKELGLVVMSPKKFPMKNPYVTIARESERICTGILTEFGMTPSSRTRVKAK